MSTDYQAIPRRFRPQQFKDIVGQKVTVKTLKNSLAMDRCSHAYLFSGSRGTGKTSTARIFAKALLCSSKSDEQEPCNECNLCQEITQGNSLNVIEIDGASNRGIDDIRKINENTAYPPEKGNFRIFIIDEVHMLTKEAFNALLKTLEEPPPHVKFIFATTEAHKVPPTISSRCQKFSFTKHKPEEIALKLQSIASEMSISLAPEASEYISMFSDGSLRDAECLLDQAGAFAQGSITLELIQEVLGLPETDLIIEIDRALKAQDIAAILTSSQKIFNEGKDHLLTLEALIEHFRKVMHAIALGSSSSSVILAHEQPLYKKLATSYSADQCRSAIDQLIKCQLSHKDSHNFRIYFENTLINLSYFLNTVAIESVLEKLCSLETAVTQQSPIVSHTSPQTTPAKKISKEEPDDDWDNLHKPNKKTSAPSPSQDIPPATKKRKSESSDSSEPLTLNQQENNKIDTILQFSAVELEGPVKKSKIKIHYEEN
ncbi:MAG: DNA polymerase III subunit gamma/tau [Chlamydiales bacterium]|nr:DNA polymerase III subunit gamma/tau [Chlamydiales bacterium]NCF70162.1 DNA polymerase III subunit gamma/tau [Chlamydiales bacterium]